MGDTAVVVGSRARCFEDRSSLPHRLDEPAGDVLCVVCVAVKTGTLTVLIFVLSKGNLHITCKCTANLATYYYVLLLV